MVLAHGHHGGDGKRPATTRHVPPRPGGIFIFFTPPRMKTEFERFFAREQLSELLWGQWTWMRRGVGLGPWWQKLSATSPQPSPPANRGLAGACARPPEKALRVSWVWRPSWRLTNFTGGNRGWDGIYNMASGWLGMQGVGLFAGCFGTDSGLDRFRGAGYGRADDEKRSTCPGCCSHRAGRRRCRLGLSKLRLNFDKNPRLATVVGFLL
ncbi:MAG: hypothetical protein JWR26_4426 [Pedosphaera sp.]|nr:hypothetical protein [Pedosphaera sp.]